MELDSNSGYPICLNPACKYYGHSHPNCRCYAEGGKVGNFCSFDSMHDSSCPFYSHGGNVHAYNPPPLYAEGGDVAPDHTGLTMGHYAQNRGLLDLLSKAGHSNSPDGMRHIDEYLGAAEKSKKQVHGHVSNLYSKKVQVEPRETAGLRAHIDELEANPSKMLDIGGNLNTSMPEHGIEIAATAARAMEYFKNIKPKGQQATPFDKVSPPDKQAELAYNRQLHVAENPSIVLQHLHDGTLLPQDLVTIKTIYPHLLEDLIKRVTDDVINKSGEVPYKQRLAMSLLVGQPTDFSQTSAAKQAIMASAAPQQQQRLQTPQKNSHGHVEKTPTNAALKQIDKVDQLAETPLESRLVNKHKA